jgi:pimeloyl-ACP methyl ester carboxylesterase
VLSPNNPAWCRKLERTSQNEGGWGEIEGVGSVLRGGAGEPLVVAPFPLDARMKAIMPRLLELDARPWLGTLRVPALVIAGSDDVVAPVAHVRSLAEALRAQWLEVAGAGHVPSATRHDEVTTAIRAFVARTAVQA